jgi:hypothetical protein
MGGFLFDCFFKSKKEPLKVFVFDSPLFQMIGRYINRRRDLTDRNIFSGGF